MMVLNNRELATLIWLAVATVWILSHRNLRSGVAGIFKTLAHPMLLLPLLGMLGWIALEIWAGWKLALWNSGLISNTAVWTVGTALVLYFNVNKAVEDPRFFRKTATGTLKASVFVEFFINLFVFGLLAELILQFVLTVLVMLDAVSGQKPEHKQVKKVVGALVGGAGLMLLGYTIVQLYAQWAQLDRHGLLLKVTLPVWLTIGVLPVVYVLSLYIVYDQALRGVLWASSDRLTRWRTGYVLVREFRLRVSELRSFTRMWIKRVAVAPDVTGARAVVQQFRDEQRATEQAKRDADERLRRYAGSNETDVEGRRLACIYSRRSRFDRQRA